MPRRPPDDSCRSRATRCAPGGETPPRTRRRWQASDPRPCPARAFAAPPHRAPIRALWSRPPGPEPSRPDRSRASVEAPRPRARFSPPRPGARPAAPWALPRPPSRRPGPAGPGRGRAVAVGSRAPGSCVPGGWRVPARPRHRRSRREPLYGTCRRTLPAALTSMHRGQTQRLFLFGPVSLG
jgi:hypothetical protein